MLFKCLAPQRFNSAAKKERGRAPRPGVACWVIDRRRELVTRLKSPAVLRKVTPYMFLWSDLIIYENLSYTKAFSQPHTPRGVSVGAAVLDGGAAH
jgi:hypothetical protein